MKNKTTVFPQKLEIESECMSDLRNSINAHLYGILTKLAGKQIEEGNVSIKLSIRTEPVEDGSGTLAYKPDITFKVTSAYQEKYENKGNVANATHDLFFDGTDWMLVDHRNEQTSIYDYLGGEDE